MNAIAPDPYPNRYTPEGRAQIKRDTADLKHLRETEPKTRIVCEPRTCNNCAQSVSNDPKCGLCCGPIADVTRWEPKP